MSVHYDHIDTGYGPEVVVRGAKLGMAEIESDLALVIGDDPVAVLEGSLEELQLFVKKCAVALAPYDHGAALVQTLGAMAKTEPKGRSLTRFFGRR